MTSSDAASRALVMDDLLDRARQQAGLEDFGDDWFLEPLAQLLRFINEEANLVNADVGPVQGIVACLVDRLRLVAFLGEHPEVRDEVVDVGGVIIGLPRGGSTLAQRLLASAPQLASLYKYDVCAPIPLPGEPIGDPGPRIERTEKRLDAIMSSWPDLASMHPMRATDYEEEVELLERSFACIMYYFYFHVPSYGTWLFHYDDRKLYDELILWLKLLQFQDPSRRGKKWLLKCPQHLMSGSISSCMDAFPGASILMTHRNLRSVIGSACSMQYSMLKDITRDLDPRVIGPEAVEQHRRALERMIEVRNQSPPERFIDLQYADLLSDPIGQFEMALGRMEIAVTDSDREAATAWMSGNQRNTHPPHRYEITDYGVDLDEFDATFDFYHDRFVETGR